MHRLILVAALAAACGENEGRRVTAWVVDETVECATPVGGDRPIARITLSSPNDVYLAEVVDPERDLRITVDAERDGNEVTFTCPGRLERFTVRRVTWVSGDGTSAEDDEVPAPEPP